MDVDVRCKLCICSSPGAPTVLGDWVRIKEFFNSFDNTYEI